MRIGFCDDDRVFLELLAVYCRECLPFVDQDEQVDAECMSSGEKLLESYRRGKTFDILFIDLKMKGLNGFETARQIRMVDNRVIIIFVTSLAHCVMKCFEYKPFWYLIKPVTRRVSKCVHEGCCRVYVRQPRRICFQHQDRWNHKAQYRKHYIPGKHFPPDQAACRGR